MCKLTFSEILSECSRVAKLNAHQLVHNSRPCLVLASDDKQQNRKVAHMSSPLKMFDLSSLAVSLNASAAW